MNLRKETTDQNVQMKGLRLLSIYMFVVSSRLGSVGLLVDASQVRVSVDGGNGSNVLVLLVWP